MDECRRPKCTRAASGPSSARAHAGFPAPTFAVVPGHVWSTLALPELQAAQRGYGVPLFSMRSRATWRRPPLPRCARLALPGDDAAHHALPFELSGDGPLERAVSDRHHRAGTAPFRDRDSRWHARTARRHDRALALALGRVRAPRAAPPRHEHVCTALLGTRGRSIARQLAHDRRFRDQRLARLLREPHLLRTRGPTHRGGERRHLRPSGRADRGDAEGSRSSAEGRSLSVSRLRRRVCFALVGEQCRAFRRLRFRLLHRRRPAAFAPPRAVRPGGGAAGSVARRPGDCQPGAELFVAVRGRAQAARKAQLRGLGEFRAHRSGEGDLARIEASYPGSVEAYRPGGIVERHGCGHADAQGGQSFGRRTSPRPAAF